MTLKQPIDQLVKVKIKGGMMQGLLQFRHDFAAKKLLAYQQAQRYVDNEVLRRCDPLTPRLKGELISSGVRATSIGSGIVQYNSPYARYQYYGKVMIGRAPKTVTSIPLTYTDAPNRGAKWFERMKTKDKKDILKGAGRIVAK